MIKELILIASLLASPVAAEYIPIDDGVLMDPDALSVTDSGFYVPAAIIIDGQVFLFFAEIDCLYDKIRYSQEGIEWTEWKQCDNENPFFRVRLKHCNKRMA